jgi:hypothetical protein
VQLKIEFVSSVRARVVAHNYYWARFVGLATLLATLLTIPMAMPMAEQAPSPYFDPFGVVAYHKEEKLNPYAAVQKGCMRLCCDKPPHYEGSQADYVKHCIRSLFQKSSTDPCKEIKRLQETDLEWHHRQPLQHTGILGSLGSTQGSWAAYFQKQFFGLPPHASPESTLCKIRCLILVIRQAAVELPNNRNLKIGSRQS